MFALTNKNFAIFLGLLARLRLKKKLKIFHAAAIKKFLMINSENGKKSNFAIINCKANTTRTLNNGGQCNIFMSL